MTNPFAYRRSGTTGHEILDPNGLVIAWTVDVGWAGIIVGLLNKAAPFQSSPNREPTMTKQEIKNLVQMLLNHRPDLVIVKTESPQEKKTLVEILKKAGAKVIYRETKE
jgi:hypothetical protein